MLISLFTFLFCDAPIRDNVVYKQKELMKYRTESEDVALKVCQMLEFEGTGVKSNFNKIYDSTVDTHLASLQTLQPENLQNCSLQPSVHTRAALDLV